MDASRRKAILNAYLRHSRRFDEIAASPFRASGLFRHIETAAPKAGREAALLRHESGRLSARQQDVLLLIAGGLSNKEIGAKLGIKSQTVKTHVEDVLHRLDARNRAHAVFSAYRHGLLDTNTAFPTQPPPPVALPDAPATTPLAGRTLAAPPRHVKNRRPGDAARDVPAQARKPQASSPARSRERAAVKATRLADRPIIVAGSVPGYGPIFNAGAIHLDGSYHLFARAIRDGYRRNPKTGLHEPRFLDYISDVLIFTSSDGLDYRFQKPLHESSSDAVYEDPRIQVVMSGGEPHFLLSHTNVDACATGTPWRAAISELSYDGSAFTLGRELLVGPEHVPNKDVVLCNLNDGRIALIQRLDQQGSATQSIQLATFDTLEDLWEPTPDHWRRYTTTFGEHVILTPSPGAAGIGAGAPPLRLDGDLVFFYHERDDANIYTTRAALLDADTGCLRSTLPYPILTPELPWELRGDVDNVVFVQGAQLRDDGTIYLTYGAADRHVGAATVDERSLLAALRAAEAHSGPAVSAAAA